MDFCRTVGIHAFAAVRISNGQIIAAMILCLSFLAAGTSTAIPINTGASPHSETFKNTHTVKATDLSIILLSAGVAIGGGTGNADFPMVTVFPPPGVGQEIRFDGPPGLPAGMSVTVDFLGFPAGTLFSVKFSYADGVLRDPAILVTSLPDPLEVIVPEPSTALLLALGLVGLAMRRRQPH